MSKSLVALLFVVAIVAASSDSLAPLRKVIASDECTMTRMDALKPKLEVQLQLLQENKNNLQAKAELMTLIQQAKAISTECGLDKKTDVALGDIVEATGVSFLLASNCFKDVGIVLLLVDSVVQDPKDVTNDIIIAIFGAILGKQGYKDCSQFINFVIG